MASSKLFATLLPLVLAATYTSAHGIVRDITIEGTKYVGPDVNQGFRAAGASVIRQVLDTSPVKGATNAAMTCGTNATPASLVANANPGDQVAFNWGSVRRPSFISQVIHMLMFRLLFVVQWPHRVGPLITYMASCGSVSCGQFDASQAKWFKIDQQGIASGAWAQARVADGQPARVTIPANLAPGNYLMRHEIIALHNAISVGGVEFYPSCSQLKVGGTGTGAPAGSDLVSFPGAYSDNDPGIVVPDIFNGNVNYVFPGPAISKLGGTASPGKPAASSSKVSTPTVVNNGGGAATGAPAASSSPSPAATSAPATQAPAGTDYSYPDAGTTSPAPSAPATQAPAGTDYSYPDAGTTSPVPSAPATQAPAGTDYSYPDAGTSSPAPSAPAPATPSTSSSGSTGSSSSDQGKTCQVGSANARSIGFKHHGGHNHSPSVAAAASSASAYPEGAKRSHSRVMRRLVQSHSH